jgi:hypothetical protein
LNENLLNEGLMSEYLTNEMQWDEMSPRVIQMNETWLSVMRLSVMTPSVN